MKECTSSMPWILLVLLWQPAGLESSTGVDIEHRYAEGGNSNLGEALQFLREYDREASDMCFRVTSAQWNFATNITDANKRRMLDEQMLSAKLERLSWRRASSFAWGRLPDPLARRQLRLLVADSRSALPEHLYNELLTLIAEMKDHYSKARICPYNTRLSSYCDLSLEPDLTRILGQSRDYDEQLHLWKSWRDAVGPPLRHKYERYVQLANQAAQQNGFKDTGEQERSAYEENDLEDQLDSVWHDLMPLYRQLHGYVRRRLVERYGSDRIRSDGPIPAHLLGNMWAQSWRHLYPLLEPFPHRPLPDVTPEMLRQGYTPQRMFQLAEEFFTSMGMRPMPPEFWKYSVLERPLDRTIACKPSAWDFCNHRDYRIKQCTKVTMEDLISTHHEMAHIQYYIQYADQPLLFRAGANPGFHEAIGDAVSLLVSTPKHLQRIGLINNITDDFESSINYLMSVALEKVAYLPFAFLVDKWRWGAFAGDWPLKQMNSRWWELRLRVQGVLPPVARSEHDFDPASKYHVIADMPYTRYFVSLVVQFQLHEALCSASGHQGPLHTCDILRSRDAGRLFSEVMSLGASRPWRDVIRIMTRGRTNKLEARPMLEYFKPLTEWLSLRGPMDVGWIATGEDTALFAMWSSTSADLQSSKTIFILILSVILHFLS